MRNVLVAGGLALLIATACSNGVTTSATSNTPDLSDSSATSAPLTTTAHVGATLPLKAVLGSEAVKVTVVKVTDPASMADSVSGPFSVGPSSPNNRFVAVKLTITNTSHETIVGDANNEVNLIGADNQTYSRYSAAQTADCTNFNGGRFSLAPGDTTTGCVMLEVLKGVAITKVRFNPADGLIPGGTIGEWLVP